MGQDAGIIKMSPTYSEHSLCVQVSIVCDSEISSFYKLVTALGNETKCLQLRALREETAFHDVDVVFGY